MVNEDRHIPLRLKGAMGSINIDKVSE